MFDLEVGDGFGLDLGAVAGAVEFLSDVNPHEALVSGSDGPVDGALGDSLFRRLVLA